MSKGLGAARRVLAGILAAAAGTVAGTAVAADPAGFYIGAGGGAALYDIDYSSQVNNAYAGSAFTVLNADFGSTTKGGFKAFGGYRFNAPFAIELAYVNLGQPTATYTVRNFNAFTPGNNVRNAQYKIQGFNLSAVGVWDVNEQFSLHALIGAFYSQLKYSETGSTPQGDSYSFTADDLWQTNLSLGLGASYNFNPQWSLRADWDHFRNIGNTFDFSTSGNGQFDNIDLLSVNLVYRF